MDDRLWRLFDDIREYIPHWRPTNLQIVSFKTSGEGTRTILIRFCEAGQTTNRINEQSEQELDQSDEGQSSGASSSPVGGDQDMTDFPDTEEFVTETPDISGWMPSPTSDYQADQSDDVQSTDSLGDTSIRPHIIKLIQSTIPLIKLIRIFLKKLLNTPTSKPPFTIGTRLSSNELSSIGTQIHNNSTWPRKTSDLIFPNFERTFKTLILKALGSLAKRYDEIDLDADSRELPLSPDSDVDYTNDRFGRLEALSLDELNALQELLIQMQRCFCPHYTTNHRAPISNSPKPKVLDPLEIISRLGYTVENISAFLNAIGPIAVNLFQKPEEYDHAYGVRHLSSVHSCAQTSREQFAPGDRRDYQQIKILIGGIAKSTDASINDVIEYIKKSDLGILQDEWRRYANDLDATLTVLSRRADLTKQYEQEPDCSDEDQSDGASSSTDGDNQDTNDPSNPEKGVTKISNDDREIRLDANFTGDHEADRESPQPSVLHLGL
ncbi:hypothetical protein PSHT_12326 [Puccinia striiformis]|uniref:Uncharacterized protein n=1 Tax=Puccinia striiformis TaxID=27350 RepID=A0A2S4UX80_9BASI|nr:hypothetical protein PSHT_12326 [Puccinia striiformis]